MRREKHRFTPSSGAPGKSGAVLFAGTPADVQNLVSVSPCRAELSAALPCNLPASSSCSSRRLREPETVNGSVASPNVFWQRVRVWSVNCRNLLKRRAELEARLRNSNVDILCLQENLFSEEVEAVAISGFNLVSRLDRSSQPKRGFGSVAVYA